MTLNERGISAQSVRRREALLTAFSYGCTSSGFVVTIPALGNVVKEGDTLDEARAMVKDAITGYIESLQKDLLDVPLEKEGVAVPHHNKDIKGGTLAVIIKQAGMSVDEFLGYL